MKDKNSQGFRSFKINKDRQDILVTQGPFKDDSGWKDDGGMIFFCHSGKNLVSLKSKYKNVLGRYHKRRKAERLKSFKINKDRRDILVTQVPYKDDSVFFVILVRTLLQAFL